MLPCLIDDVAAFFFIDLFRCRFSFSLFRHAVIDIFEQAHSELLPCRLRHFRRRCFSFHYCSHVVTPFFANI